MSNPGLRTLVMDNKIIIFDVPTCQLYHISKETNMMSSNLPVCVILYLFMLSSIHLIHKITLIYLLDKNTAFHPVTLLLYFRVIPYIKVLLVFQKEA